MTYTKVKRKKVNTGREQIVFDIRPILAARGILHPHKFLKITGLSKTFIQQCIDGKVTLVGNKHVELLCRKLHCTPGDLYVYNGPPIEDELHNLYSFANRKFTFLNPRSLLENLSLQELEAWMVSRNAQTRE